MVLSSLCLLVFLLLVLLLPGLLLLAWWWLMVAEVAMITSEHTNTPLTLSTSHCV